MLPFNASVYKNQYPNLVINYTDEQLNNIWYSEALILGTKVLSLFNDNTPTDMWNANTNIPPLNNATGQVGKSYLCNVGGTVDFGAGNILFKIYDIVSFNSALYQWLNIGQPYNYYWAGVVMAHILSLYNKPIVGRLNKATEGDVEGEFTYEDTLNSSWWNQTTYGARCYKLMKQRGGFTFFGNNPYQGFYWQGNNNIYG